MCPRAATLLFVLLPAAAAAEPLSGLGVVTTLSGQATVARPSLAEPTPLRFRDAVFARDRISTASRSIVRVLVGGRSLVTVRELSVLTIADDSGRSTVELETGKVALSVLRQRMRPGEAIELRTPNAVAAMRGAVIVTEYVPAPRRTNLYVLRDEADVRLRRVTGAPAIRLVAPAILSIVDDIPGQPRRLGPDEVRAITADLEVKQHTGVPTVIEDSLGTRERAAAVAESRQLGQPSSGQGKCPSPPEPCAGARGYGSLSTPSVIGLPGQGRPPGCRTQC
ncbi:MAG TPA: FecR domain-containing protein [Methylomirabilota bacterium]|nr:FecR domain-containing protein [Methylomirabilota bacterium]